MDWNELQHIAATEMRRRESLEAELAGDDRNGELALRLARACVRDKRLVEALGRYDRPAAAGMAGLEAERAVVARMVGDFPEPGGRSA